MPTKVYDLPNRDRVKLCMVQESVQDLAPVLRAVKNAKVRLDAQYGDAGFVAGLAKHTADGAALTPPVVWPDAPDTGVAFGDFDAIVASISDPVLKANLLKENDDGFRVYDQTWEFPLGAIGAVVEWFKELEAPKLTDPVEVDDNTLAETEILFSGYQFVLDCYETLFVQRGLTVPA